MLKAPEIGDALFYQFIDIMAFLTGQLPKEMLRNIAKELNKIWLGQQSEKIPDDKQLKFLNPWLKAWCEEYSVSLNCLINFKVQGV